MNLIMKKLNSWCSSLILLMCVCVYSYELGRNLNSLVIENVEVSGMSVDRFEYVNVTFVNVSFRNVAFERCSMCSVRFINSTLVNVRLYSSHLKSIVIESSRLEMILNENSELNNLKVSGSILSDCLIVSEESRPVMISGVYIESSNVSGVSILNAKVSDMSLNSSKMVNIRTTGVLYSNYSLYSSLYKSESVYSNNINRKCVNFDSYEDCKCFYCDLNVEYCSYVHMHTPFLLKDDRLSCNMFHYIDRDSATISKCALGLYNSSLIEKCNRDIKRYESFEYENTPTADLILRKMTVNSGTTSRIYKNIFCAICNGERLDNLEFNSLFNSYKFKTFEDPPSYIYDIENPLLSVDNFVKLMLLDDTIKSVNDHISFRKSINACSRFVSTCTDFSNMDDVYKCYWYPSAYRLQEVNEVYTIYRNKYCAKCNRITETYCSYSYSTLNIKRFPYVYIHVDKTRLLNMSSNWLRIEKETIEVGDNDNSLPNMQYNCTELERKSIDIYELSGYVSRQNNYTLQPLSLASSI